MRQLDHHEVRNVPRRHPLSLVCPDWRDPRNVGSAFRLADAAGLAGLYLTGTTPHPPNAKLARTARSTVRSVSWSAEADTVAFLRSRKAAGALVVALEITDRSVSLLSPTLAELGADAGARDVLLLAGSETGGLAPAVLAECDLALHLPMYGANTSMNVVVACGVAVYLLIDRWYAP